MKEDGQLMLKDSNSLVAYYRGLLKLKIINKEFRVMGCVDWSGFVDDLVIFLI